MKKFFSGLALLTAVLLLGSCQDDDIFDWGKKQKHRTYGENEVAFVIGGEKGVNTRAEVQQTLVAPTNVIDLPREEGEPQLCLTMTVTSMDDEIFDAVNGATRGTPIYTENFDQVYADQLYVTAFEPGEPGETGTEQTEAKPYTTSQIWGGSDFTRVKYNKVADELHTYSYNYSSGSWNLPWPASGNLQFFLQAPSETLPGEGSPVSELDYYPDGSFSFKYQTPLSKTVKVGSGEQEKAASVADDQKDLLFGSRIITKSMNEPDHNAHEVLLYHALSAVKFKMGSSEVMQELGIKITSVVIDLKGSGTCTVTPKYTDYNDDPDNQDKWTFPHSNDEENPQEGTKSADCVTWTALDFNTTPFYVEFPSTLAGTETGETAATVPFPDGFYKQTAGADGTIADHNLNNGAYSKTFMVVPQEVSADGNHPTYITVNYTINGKATSKQIMMPHDTWKAGQLRTFTLDALIVDVSITDKIAGNVKSDLTTTNEGTAAQYQRVMLDANWVFYDEEYGNCIIDTYPIVVDDPNGDTKGYVNVTGFEGFPGEGWLLGSDGFFYYKYPIAAGASPKVPLFTSFTRPTPAANDKIHEGAHVEMTISVQAVKYEASQTSLMTFWDMSLTDGPKWQTLGTADPLGHRARTESSSNGYIFSQLSTTIEQ